MPSAASGQPDDGLERLKQDRDVGGLIRLLKQAEPGRKPEVVEALRELTGKDLGTKARLWERWHRSNPTTNHHFASRWARHAATALKAVLVVGSLQALRWAGRRFLRRPR